MNINPFEILKNAQKIQEQMGAFQEKLGSLKVTGSSGGGMVEIEMNGRMEVLAVRIGKEAVEEGEEMLQDLVAASFNNALEKIREAVNREMGTLTGMPGGFPGMPGFPS
ncbi:MAG: YbaB/EbfC family nucleoid-associated protein [Treponema sp.]|jgi:DNA-binding YbaB/EbfC family protein|nr:YbaB/EbfC family nucleoid-associated protein [Treponema sp.]